MGADAARPPSPPSGPAGVTEGLSVAGAQPMGAATANSTLRYGLTVETPRSPSYDTTLLWRRDLAKRLRRRSRPTPIPARHPKAAVIDRTTEKRKSLQETTKEVNKPIIKAQSVRSHASSRTVIEAQLSQAELEASERLAEISRRELQLEADMVRKRLDARKLQIRANADSADEHESAGSVRNSNQDRLDEWLENSRDATSKPICKRLTDEPLSKYETPRRPAQAERHIRGLSPDRQRRRRSTTPPARRERSTSPQLDARTPHTAHTRATEGTVAESMLHLFERMQMAARPAPKDIFELPHFYGDVSEWRSFYNTYAETSKRYKFTDYENVARLRMALRGDAKTCVSHVLSTATRPDMIVRILKKQFGRSESLLGILLRFREWEFAVTADIQEMFLQIQLRREDRHSQLFIWRGSRRDVTPWTYQLNRVCFGNISSPFLAHSVRNRNATDNKDRYPDAVYDIHNNHYMDDYVASYETERELISTATQVRLAHAEASFRLRSYASNNELLMRNIDPEERATGPSHLGEKQQTVLGMTWDPETDTLGYNTKMLRVPDDVKRYERSPTKRELLSAVMSVYDPLGLIAQYMISAKIIFQRVWTKGTDWDERLPAEEAEDFFRWLRALSDVSALRIPRRYATPTGAVRRELHIFSDASTEAYSAAAYWRVSNDEEETQVSLAIAKSRVCPLKVMTVPRLELTAAVVGVRLAETILREQRYPVTKVTYWTDSMVVLGWVRDDARNYRPYVSHRLAEIAEKTDRDAWRYVPTAQNPADRATRCQPAQSVRIEDEWYEGPRFLYGPETSWPSHTSNRTDDLPERKARPSTATSLAIISAKPDPSSVLPDVRRFSSYDRLLNATANVLLFIEKTRTKNKALQLQVRHLRKAEHMWLQYSQRRSFPEELRALSQNRLIDRKSRLYDLAPELGDDGVLRMKTRLGSAPVLYTALQPIILDSREPFTRLLILRAHRRSAHIHNEAVINELRQEYWILHLRPTVKSVARNCALCTLRRATPRAQPLGDLPPERLQAYQRPFTHTAQDYMGPMFVTIGRRREKRWVCLYTCLVTRAIHLESVHSLSTDSALLSLRRFAARRGWPRTMYSDNATCFRAAATELREAYRQWLPVLQTYATQNRMEWKFIPPGNPSAGGAWERMIRTVKIAMSYTFNERAPKPEVFETLLAEIENIVNRRPLTHVNVDPDSEESLTPAHFLLLHNANLPMIGVYDENEKKQWKMAQALADHFWRRWTKEYFPLLAPRKSSHDGGRQLQPGDVVIVAEPNGPRSVWPRGVVETTYPGPDGRVRSADIRTRHGTLRRPSCRLAVIASQPMHQESSTAGTKC
ncbi:uncharacterized protein LOC125238899 [Leguminivora glycinivorella]|uniref:uncharacterized protein LOC125238899 n=1 Tax=Leguminivora glycinivorella TaxID=1035111 RepID=UPI00200CFF30|nr:uncharacterized protein LOC125238899 [Leguminivora glycinivorella]